MFEILLIIILFYFLTNKNISCGGSIQVNHPKNINKAPKLYINTQTRGKAS